MTIIDLESIENVRSLDGIAVAGGRRVKPGLFFRGTALAGISEGDQDLLFGGNGIRRVIDVRCRYEREAKPDPQIEGIENIWLPYFDEEEVGYTYFKPLPGTKSLGNDFVCNPEDVYRSLTNPLTARQFKKVLGIVFQEAAAGHGIYYHCSGGKDRAGVTSMLILAILGADFAEIAADYELTNISRDKHLDRIYDRMLPMCGDPDFARRCVDEHRADKRYAAAFFDQIEKDYGSFEDFASEHLGIDAAKRDELRAQFTEPSATADAS